MILPYGAGGVPGRGEVPMDPIRYRAIGRLMTSSCPAQTERLRVALRGCDAVVIGAGAGLSASAGFVYDGERFEKKFSDFARRYGFSDMYTGGFYPFSTPQEHWAYWSR